MSATITQRAAHKASAAVKVMPIWEIGACIFCGATVVRGASESNPQILCSICRGERVARNMQARFCD